MRAAHWGSSCATAFTQVRSVRFVIAVIVLSIVGPSLAPAQDIDINDPCWPEVNALRHIKEYTSGILTPEQAKANLASCRRRQDAAQQAAKAREAANAVEEAKRAQREADLARVRQAQEEAREKERRAQEDAHSAQVAASIAQAELEATHRRQRIDGLRQDKREMRAGLSAFICTAKRYRAAAVAEIREQQKYARLGGGVIDMGAMKSLQDQMRTSDAAISAARVALGRLNVRPMNCRGTGEPLAECFNEDGDAVCDSDLANAVSILVSEAGFSSNAPTVNSSVPSVGEDRILVNTKRAIDDSLKKPSRDQSPDNEKH